MINDIYPEANWRCSALDRHVRSIIAGRQARAATVERSTPCRIIWQSICFTSALKSKLIHVIVASLNCCSLRTCSQEAIPSTDPSSVPMNDQSCSNCPESEALLQRWPYKLSVIVRSVSHVARSPWPLYPASTVCSVPTTGHWTSQYSRLHISLIPPIKSPHALLSTNRLLLILALILPRHHILFLLVALIEGLAGCSCACLAGDRLRAFLL